MNASCSNKSFVTIMHRNKVIPSYFGSKNVNGLYQFIINRFKKHSTYIEGFLGSGIILQMKQPAKQSIAFDLDTAVIDKFNSYGREHNVKLINGSFIDNFVHGCRHQDLTDTLVYLDPPYVQSTRTSAKRYKHELTLKQHEQLLSLVLQVKTNYVISCYDNELYSSMLQGWNKEHCNSITRAGVRVETVYYNYDVLPGDIAEFTYAGKDFTDRQRIKRKVARTINKFKRLPELEKIILLQELKKEFY